MIRPLALAATLAAALGASTAAAQADPKRGEKLFEECVACHMLERDVEGVGPSLYGMFGRKAGSSDSFRYSPAMKRSNIAWTPQTLDAYLADPQKMVPANRMPYAGMPDARDRAEVILYLRQMFK